MTFRNVLITNNLVHTTGNTTRENNIYIYIYSLYAVSCVSLLQRLSSHTITNYIPNPMFNINVQNA